MMRPVPPDTRGIVDPAAMMQHVDFARAPSGDVLDGIIEWFWSVAWDLPDGYAHDQQVLNHPAGNISVGTIDDSGVLDPAEGRVYGVLTGMSTRHLVGRGWTVAARTTVGGVGVLLDRRARSVVDTQLTFADALRGIDGDALAAAVAGDGSNETRTELLRDGLEGLVDRRDPALLAEAREVAAVATVAERDRSIRRVEELASVAGVSVRTLQRLFDHHVGVSPSAVIRRWRIIEAAEAARTAVEAGHDWRGWSDVATNLGYSDQAHLTRDFRRHLGTSPAAYLAQVTPSTG